jgi:hypothetical protein
MKRIKNFALFESEEESYTFEQLPPNIQEIAIQNVREEMWEGKHGSSDIPEWVIDDDYIFEPTHDEMVKIFGENYNDSLDGNPMIANDRKDISYVSRDDQNYYLHCREALNITNDGMFLGFLGIPPYFWDELNYRFYDRGTYTEIEFEIEDEDDLREGDLDSLNKYIGKAEKKFKDHMGNVLYRITSGINDQYEDESIKERIENDEILFDSEGNPLD